MAAKELFSKMMSGGGDALSDAEFAELKQVIASDSTLKPIAEAMLTGGGDALSDEQFQFLKSKTSKSPRLRGKLKKTEAPRDLVGETAQDFLATGVKATGGLVKGIGAVPGLLTGDFDNAVTRAGQSIQEAGRAGQSDFLHEQEAALAERQRQAEGQGFWAEAGATAKGYLENPATLAEPIAGSAAFLAPMGAVAGGTGLLIKGAKLAPKLATGLKVTTGLATGAGLQGGSVGEEVYQEIKNLPRKVLQRDYEWMQMVVNQNMNPDDATRALAEKYARRAGNTAAAIAMVGQLLAPGIENTVMGTRLPGVGVAMKRALRKKIGRSAGSKVSGIASTSLAEATEQGGELFEEMGGQIAGNVAVGNVDERKKWSEGLGTTAVSTALTTPAMSGVVSVNEGFDLGMRTDGSFRLDKKGATGDKTPSASAGTEAGTGKPADDGTFPRTRGKKLVTPGAPASPIVTPDAPVADQPVEQPAVPDAGVPAVEPVATPVPPDQAQPAEAPVAPAVEAPEATPEAATEAAPEVAPDVAPEAAPPAPEPVDPFAGMSDKDLLSKLPTMSAEEAKAIAAMPMVDGSKSERYWRGRLKNQADRHVRSLENAKPTKPARLEIDLKTRAKADRDISLGRKRIVELMQNGEPELAGKLAEALRPIYDQAFGSEAQENYDADMRIAQRQVEEKAAKKAGKQKTAAPQIKEKVKSIPDVQANMTNVENYIKKAASTSKEAYDDALSLYSEAWHKNAVSLYPEGTKADEYIAGKRAEFEASLPVATEPAVAPAVESVAPAAPAAPVAPVAPEATPVEPTPVEAVPSAEPAKPAKKKRQAPPLYKDNPKSDDIVKPKDSSLAKPLREKKAEAAAVPAKAEQPKIRARLKVEKTVDSIADQINNALDDLSAELGEDAAGDMAYISDKVNRILDSDMDGKMMAEAINDLVLSKKTEANKDIASKIKEAIEPFRRELGKVKTSVDIAPVETSSSLIQSAIAGSTDKIKVRIRPGNIYVAIDGEGRNAGKLDLSDTNPSPQDSWDLYSQILTSPEILKQVVSHIESLGEAGKATLQKIQAAATTLLNEDGNIDPDQEEMISKMFSDEVASNVVENVSTLNTDDKSAGRLIMDMAVASRRNLVTNALNPDDIAMIRSAMEAAATRDEKVVQLNDITALLGLGLLGLGTAAVVGGYKGAKATVKGAKATKEGIKKLLDSDMYKRGATFVLPPETAIANWARALLNDKNISSDRKAAVRKLMNTTGQFLDSVRNFQVELFNLFRDASESVSSADKEKYGAYYRTWVENEGASTEAPKFKAMPEPVQKAFINFQAITGKLGTKLGELGGSPRSNWVWRIANQEGMRRVKSMAVGAARVAKALDLNTGDIKAIKDLRSPTVEAANSVPNEGPLGKAILSAMNNPTDGLLHGFIGADGKPNANIENLPGYLRHEVTQSADKEAPEPLFPALMDYKAEPLSDGTIKYTPVIKDLKDRDPSEIRVLVRSEAFRVIGEMFDHEYSGGRLGDHIPQRVRQRAYKTDGSLVNGREMPYLGDDLYVSDPWQALPQIITRQTRGMARWEHFGRNREKLNAIIHAIGPVHKSFTPGGVDKSMGVRFPKNGSANLDWNPDKDAATIAGLLDDIAMGYYASKTPGSGDVESYANPDGTYSFGGRTKEVIMNLLANKHIEAFVNFSHSGIILGALRASMVAGAINEAGALPGSAMHGMTLKYMKERIKVGAKKGALERAVREGKTDSSYRVASTKWERRADNLASTLGTFDPSTAGMDAGARETGIAAFNEALLKYADARDLGWDDNSTNYTDLMQRAKRLRQDLEMMYSPEELDEAIRLVDNPTPENTIALDKMGERFAREMAKSISGLSDKSAQTGLNRYWIFNKTAGFLTGVTLAMTMQHMNDLLREGSLTGMSRRERAVAYAKGAIAAGTAMKMMAGNMLAAMVFSSIITRSYLPLVIRGALVAALAYKGLKPLDTYSSAVARIHMSHGVDHAKGLAEGDLGHAMAGVSWLAKTATSGLPWTPRMMSLGIGDAITPLDRKIAQMPEYSGQGVDLTKVVPAISYPYREVSNLLGGGYKVAKGLGEKVTGSPTADARILQGALQLGTAGGFFTKEIGQSKKTGEAMTNPWDAANRLIDITRQPFTDQSVDERINQMKHKQ